MTEITLNVPGINCGHCENTINLELAELDGISSVLASSDSKTVVVKFADPVNETVIRDLLTEINYPAEA